MLSNRRGKSAVGGLMAGSKLMRREPLIQSSLGAICCNGGRCWVTGDAATPKLFCGATILPKVFVGNGHGVSI